MSPSVQLLTFVYNNLLTVFMCVRCLPATIQLSALEELEARIKMPSWLRSNTGEVIMPKKVECPNVLFNVCSNLLPFQHHKASSWQIDRAQCRLTEAVPPWWTMDKIWQNPSS